MEKIENKDNVNLYGKIAKFPKNTKAITIKNNTLNALEKVPNIKDVILLGKKNLFI